jgi:hypothetical protein
MIISSNPLFFTIHKITQATQAAGPWSTALTGAGAELATAKLNAYAESGFDMTSFEVGKLGDEVCLIVETDEGDYLLSEAQPDLHDCTGLTFTDRQKPVFDPTF